MIRKTNIGQLEKEAPYHKIQVCKSATRSKHVKNMPRVGAEKAKEKILLPIAYY